jgi:hypothetical protein
MPVLLTDTPTGSQEEVVPAPSGLAALSLSLPRFLYKSIAPLPFPCTHHIHAHSLSAWSLAGDLSSPLLPALSPCGKQKQTTSSSPACVCIYDDPSHMMMMMMMIMMMMMMMMLILHSFLSAIG